MAGRPLDTSLLGEPNHIPAEAGGTLGVRPRLPDQGRGPGHSG